MKMKRKILAVLMVMVMSMALVACGGKKEEVKEDTKEAATGGDEVSVNVILKTTASEYWGYVMAGCEAYAKDNANVKVDVQGASSETAYDEQLNIIETNLASDQYDGFVIAPLQADMVVQQIAGQAKPIIAVDTDIDAPEVLSFVGTGNEEAAYSGGKTAVEMAKEAGWDDLKAIAISGVEGDSTATARLTGYQKGIEEAGGEFLKDEIQYADAVADKAYASMEAVIQNHPKGVAMIVCNNDDMAIAAARAAAGNEAYKNTIFVGFDGIQSACEAILAGEETMSVAQNAYDMGYKAVEACVKAIQGNEIESFIDSGSSIVNKDNAQEQLDTLKSYLK
ncbi:sugar ABC transporter substrate-binding protein [Lachnospiraceae bacterium PAL113]|uniref:Sugar ABC transporter substrate-binding protein n=2 Tax=Aequitasia blattaphilus TaxID=2949332 RepID=A0ABT1E6G1_9FIRM|nr:sugar ABC transporter substrate-binding protein [Aequitasia blattaphilus]MCP1101415.1 sugar ABC transporter substrate-binding protein [Aequitasia blattaphilus]MCR8614055.1 sugar ABC transporter substrate-binding protein [Aequitasia blattaphilus]